MFGLFFWNFYFWGNSGIQNCQSEISKLSNVFLECSNKMFKNFRLHRARKHSRIATMTDVFHRMLQCSDPLILHSKINKNLSFAKNKPLSETVKSMLLLDETKGFISFDDYMKQWITGSMIWNWLIWNWINCLNFSAVCYIFQFASVFWLAKMAKIHYG